MPPTEPSSRPSALQALARLTDVGALSLTPDRTLDFISPRARALLGCPADERTAACWRRVRAALDPVLDRIGPAPHDAAHETVFLGEAPAGQQIMLDVYRLPDITEAPSGYLVIVKDRDAMQRVEHSLRLAMQMRHTGPLYEAVAHDLRQPIGAILIHLKVLEGIGHTLSDTVLHTSHQEALDTIRHEVKELDNSLQLLLRELSPKDTEELFSLRDMVRGLARLIHPLVEKAGLRLDTVFPDHDIVIRGHRFRIKQAILNLATNAVEAMTTGTLTIRLGVAGDEACIIVRDEGPGIPPEVQMRMYDRHFTTKPHGTGLGLHLVKETIEAHGGRVAVASTPGEGTTFSLYLPLPEPDPLAAAPPPIRRGATRL